MDVTKSQKQKRIRVISGPCAVVEAQLEEMLDEWQAIVWNFIELAGVLTMTVVLIHASLAQKPAIAIPRNMIPHRN